MGGVVVVVVGVEPLGVVGPPPLPPPPALPKVRDEGEWKVNPGEREEGVAALSPAATTAVAVAAAAAPGVGVAAPALLLPVADASMLEARA